MISSAFANDLLKLIFNGSTITGIAENDTASPLTNLYVSLHTGDPGAGGSQTTNEVSYTGYSRLAVTRGGGGFAISGNKMNPAATMELGEVSAIGSPQTVTHMCIGTTGGSSAGKVLFRFTVSPTITLAQNVTPRLRTTTELSVVTS